MGCLAYQLLERVLLDWGLLCLCGSDLGDTWSRRTFFGIVCFAIPEAEGEGHGWGVCDVSGCR